MFIINIIIIITVIVTGISIYTSYNMIYTEMVRLLSSASPAGSLSLSLSTYIYIYVYM